MIKDLTVGRESRVMCSFVLPMFVSVIFQQLYNIADSVIAGRFAGEDALSAVGASYPITMIFMAIAVGANIGCSVVISTLFGSKQYERMKCAISTTLISSFILSAVLSVAGAFLTPLLMRMVNTPDNIFDDASLYLNIYIYGLVFLFIYNVCTGIFTSLGDSKTPLYFLIGSSLGNIVLDYIFVAKFSWGVAGVAWATFIAQGAACLLALCTLFLRVRKIKTGKTELFSFSMLRQIARIAIPSILQQSFVSVGNIFIQSAVNSFGSSVIAGYSAAVKLNTFAVTSLTTLSNGMSSFTAQNFGAGKIDRVRRGTRAGLIMSLFITIPFAVIYLVFGGNAVGFFMPADSVEALGVGRTFLLYIAPFYPIIAIKIIVDGVLRGVGAMKMFLISTFCDLILRVVFAYILSPFFGSSGIWMSWPVGWLVSTAISAYFYRAGKWQNASVKK